MQSKRLHKGFKEDMPMKVLVVFHVYYEDFVSYYLDKMKNIRGCDWDLVITGRNLSTETRRLITAFKADAVFCETPNIGYDVWPFLYVIQNTDLDEYDFIIKLHTKNQDSLTFVLNGFRFNGESWRSELVEALLGSEQRFRTLTDLFRKHRDVGMAYSASLDILMKDNQPEDVEAVEKELERLGIDDGCRHFCGGTMFAARAEALEWIKNDKINASIFETSLGSHQSVTMGHIYERILSMATVAAGYRISLIKNDWYKYLHIQFKRKIQPVLEWLFSIRYCSDKAQKKITVFGLEFRLKEKKLETISVIVPAFNAEKHIADTLESVRNQNYGKWECIIVDDGSSDDTRKAAALFCKIDDRFKLIVQDNRGVSAARNRAIEAATGEFILPLDADDIIEPDYMRDAMKVFKRKPGTKLVYCKARLFGEQNGSWDLPEYDYKRFIATNCIFCTCFFRRSDAIEAGLYDESFRSGYEDWDFLLRLLKPYDKVVRINREHFRYRMHPKDTITTNSRALGCEETLLNRIAAKYPEIYGPYRDGIIRDMRK
ncbi:MAG: glycosyltransferase [Candidatus Cryptobacteroides sp.]